MSPGILGKKIGMTQVFRARRSGGAGDGAEGRPVRRDAAQDAGDGRLRRDPDRLVEFVKPQRLNKPMAGHLKKAGAEGVEVHARVSAATGRRRLQAGRPHSGRGVQAEREGRCDRRQQGPRVSPASSSGITSAAAMQRTVRCSTALPVRSAHRAFRRACFPACVAPATWVRPR